VHAAVHGLPYSAEIERITLPEYTIESGTAISRVVTDVYSHSDRSSAVLGSFLAKLDDLLPIEIAMSNFPSLARRNGD
jgi:hypothetical protein